MREVIYSLMYKRHERFEGLLRQGMIHQILANDRFWRSQPRILIQRYEELIDDPVTAVVQLGRHLGLGVTRREAQEIADLYSLESNRTRIDALRRQLERAGIDLNRSAGLLVCDPFTLLHWNHLRPAGSASWEDQATPRERLILDRLCGDWLLANGYKVKADHHSQTVHSLSGPKLDLQSLGELALARVSFLLRLAAARLPHAAGVLKRLMGISRSRADDILAHPLDEDGCPPVSRSSCSQSDPALSIP
jgi:hypothetical protein